MSILKRNNGKTVKKDWTNAKAKPSRAKSNRVGPCDR